MLAHLLQPIPRATDFAQTLPFRIDDVFTRALAKDPDQRFQSALELAGAAADALRALPANRRWTQAVASPQQTPASAMHHPEAAPPLRDEPAHLPRPRRRWAVVGAAAALIAATVVAVTVARTPEPRGPAATSAGATATVLPVAPSSNDIQPIRIITDEPTCDQWRTISDAWGPNSPLAQWNPDDPNHPARRPASAWSAEQRAAMTAASGVLQTMAAKTVPLVAATAKRVVRELYEQLIAYSRAYSASLSNYFPDVDIKLGQAFEDTYKILGSACNASHASRSEQNGWITAPSPWPTRTAAPQDPDNPQRFISRSDNSTCGELMATLQAFSDNPVAKDWSKVDDTIPAAQWTPDQKALSAKVATLLHSSNFDIQRIIGETVNPVVQDFGYLALQYRGVFEGLLASYNARSDHQIQQAGSSALRLIADGCNAVGA
jgi:hypothetical protein